MGVAFRFACGAWWVFGFVFKDEEFYPNWVRVVGFLLVCLFSSYISMCTTQCLSGSSIFSNLVCYFSIFFISHNPGAGLKNTPKDRHKILKDSTL